MSRFQNKINEGARAHTSRSVFLVAAMTLMVAGLFAQTTMSSAATTKASAPSNRPSAVNVVSSSSVYTALAAPQRLIQDVPLTSSTTPSDTTSVTVAGGSTGVPLTATGVVLTVTQTSNTAANFVQVFPAGGSTTASAVNAYFPNQLTSNLVTVPIGTNGQVTLHSLVPCHVFVDEQGYYAAATGGSTAGRYNPLPPTRITDTRAGSGQANSGATLSSGGTLRIQVTGLGGVPTGASAAVVNLTAVNDPSAGFLQAYPGARPTSPQTSNLNYNGGGQIVATRDIVTLDSTGGFTVYANVGPVDLVVDLNGWFTDASTSTGSFFTPTGVSRIHDTRISADTIAPRGVLNLPIAGQGGIPTAATAGVLNITIDKTIAHTAPINTGPGAGFVTVYPGARPLASDLNFPPNSIVPNQTYATLAADGSINIYNGSDSYLDVVVDGYGFFSTLPTSGVTVTANPSSIPADGTTTSTITVTVNNAGGPVANDLVSLNAVGTPTGTCSNANFVAPSTSSGTTNAQGQFITKLTASTTAGTCTITATEATGGLSGSTTVQETTPKSTVAFTCTPATIPADGTTTCAISGTVTNPVTSAGVVGDTVTFTLSGSPTTACGSVSPTTTTTTTGGAFSATYKASTVSGFCTITATESQTGGSGTQTVTQASSLGNGNTVAETVVCQTPTNPGPTTTSSSTSANGTSTCQISATVTNAAAAPVGGDQVMFTVSGTNCGSVSPQFTVTNASGVATTTYTASTKAAVCTVKAQEAQGGATSNAVTITQTASNTVVATANPQAVPAGGSQTSTITVTVTDQNGQPVPADTLSYTLTPSPAGSCGTITSATGTASTGTTGQATFTYAPSGIVGFCTIKFTDQAGAPGTLSSGSVTIDQTNNPAPAPFNNAVTVTCAAPGSGGSTPANGTSTCTVTDTVTAAGTAVSGDSVMFSLPATGSCGTLPGPSKTATVTTGANGQATVTYTSSKVPGTCTVSAQDAESGGTGSATITQTTVLNTITVTPTPNPCSLPVNAAGSTASTCSFKFAVTNPSGPVIGDTITVTATNPYPAGACGTVTPSSGTTDSLGTFTVTYTASATPGFCTVTGTEGNTGQSASAQVTQTTNPKQANTVTVTSTSTPNCSALVTNGTSTCTIQANVKNTSSGAPVPGDPVQFILTGTTGACGSVSPVRGTTDSNGNVTTTYTVPASTTGPTSCLVTATEAFGGASGSTTVSQTQQPNTVTLTGPTTVARSASATYTATVTNPSGAPVSGDSVNFTLSGGGCGGTLSGTNPATTGTNGQATITFTAPNASSVCTLTATDTNASGTTSSASMTITTA